MILLIYNFLCKFDVYFQNIFLKECLSRAASVVSKYYLTRIGGITQFVQGVAHGWVGWKKTIFSVFFEGYPYLNKISIYAVLF